MVYWENILGMLNARLKVQRRMYFTSTPAQTGKSFKFKKFLEDVIYVVCEKFIQTDFTLNDVECRWVTIWKIISDEYNGSP